MHDFCKTHLSLILHLYIMVTTKYLWKFLGLFFFGFLLQSVDAQVLEGKVTDDTGEPVLFATIFIEETKEGCTTNDNGVFSMPLTAGNYTIRIQHVSYQTDIQEITLPLSAPLQIRLRLKSITLREAVVKAKGEDPAYAIMRRAIAKAPYHRKQFETYHVDNYSKATLFIDHIPRSFKRIAKIGGEKLPVKAGDVYTMESISKISYEKDSLFRRIVSLKSSFPKDLVDGIENIDEFELYDIYGQTGSYISPLSPQALSAYRFRMDSYTPDDYGQLVYHIRVIPKNNNPFAFSGYIDIVDSTWHVHYFDLSAATSMTVVSTSFNIKQSFGEVEKNIWAPISYYLGLRLDAMGAKFRVNLSAARQYTDYKLNKRNYVVFENNGTTPVSDNKMIISEKSKRIEDKIMQIYQKEEISTREALKIVSLLEDKAKEDAKNNPVETVKTLEIRGNYKVTIDSMAYRRDSLYWTENRKMPLLESEQESYEKKRIADSLAENTIQKGGSRFSFQTRTLRFGFDSFPEMVSFNAVDGCKLRFGGYINKKMKDSTILENTMMVGYSFNTGHAIFELLNKYTYLPEKRASFTVFGGQESTDFNTLGVHPFVNTISSLFFKENSINLYQRSYCGIRHSIEVINGLEVRLGGLYEWRQQLFNTTEYSFFCRNKKYHPNEPNNPYLVDEQYLADGQAAIFNLGLSYTPQRRYYFDGRYKRTARSNFPTFSFLWEKGIPGVFSSVTDYDYLRLGMSHQIRLGILKKVQYNLRGGWYPRTKKMHFSEFQHFYIYDFNLIFKDFYNMYQTIKPYAPSTNEWMASGFVKYETPYLCLKYLPGLNKTLITENLYFSYLTTPHVKNYMEVGYSLNNIWMLGHIGIFVGFEQFKYANWSLKISINTPRW